MVVVVEEEEEEEEAVGRMCVLEKRKVVDEIRGWDQEEDENGQRYDDHGRVNQKSWTGLKMMALDSRSIGALHSELCCDLGKVRFRCSVLDAVVVGLSEDVAYLELLRR